MQIFLWNSRICSWWNFLKSMWQQWEMDRIQQHPLHRLVYVVENKNHLVIRNIWPFRLETLHHGSWISVQIFILRYFKGTLIWAILHDRLSNCFWFVATSFHWQSTIVQKMFRTPHHDSNNLASLSEELIRFLPVHMKGIRRSLVWVT